MTDPKLAAVLADLAAEGEWLDSVVAALPEHGWRTPTSASGWDVATSIAHLAWTDEVAVIAATDQTAWDALVAEAIADPARFVDDAALTGGAVPSHELLTRWRRARRALAETLHAVPAGTKLPWFGPPMGAVSMATARFMETWAHGLDVAEGIGVPVAPHDRVRHVVHLGHRTRDFAFHNHGLTPPAEPFGVRLIAPSGETWSFGPDDASQTVSGSAWDFALLVTQRRHRADLDLHANGPDADRWLDIAQAFAGPPGDGREPSLAAGGAVARPEEGTE